MRNLLFKLLLNCIAFGTIGILYGCGEVIQNPNSPKKRSESRTSARARLEAVAKGTEVKLLTKNEYINPEVLDDFRREFGYVAKPTYYAANQDLLDALERDSFDVVLATGTEIQWLIKQNLLSRNTNFLTNGMRVVEGFLRKLPFDPKWEYSIPYAWTAFGVGYNMDFHTEPPSSWKDLLDPEAITSDLKGKIAMFNDPRYVIGSALIYQGHSPNSTNTAEIDQAVSLLLAQRPFVREYNETNARADLAGINAFLDQSLGCDISVANTINKRIRFELPKEGTMVMVTCLAVPSKSQKQSLAGELIRFLVRPEVSAKNVNFSHRASALATTLPFVDRQVRNGPAYSFPTEASRAFFVEDLSPQLTAYYEKAWRTLLQGAAQPVKL